jgi:hypothetical protein
MTKGRFQLGERKSRFNVQFLASNFGFKNVPQSSPRASPSVSPASSPRRPGYNKRLDQTEDDSRLEETDVKDMAQFHKDLISTGDAKQNKQDEIENRIIMERQKSYKEQQTLEKFLTKTVDSRIARNKVFKMSAYICRSGLFQVFIFVTIMANSLVLAMDRYPMAKKDEDLLETYNIYFFVIFAAEMVLKLVGFGVKVYVQDKFNLFDGFIIIVSIFELSFAGGGAQYSILRVFRLFRIFKIAKSWERL